MANTVLGTKRKCLSCDTAFFDLEHDPIVCPRCKAVFTLVPLPRTPVSRWKTRVPAVPAQVEEPEAIIADDPEEDDPEALSDEAPDDDILPLA
jgi:uncharacterized protein (TIGR02300 family)